MSFSFPFGIVIQGLVLGTATGLLAVGLVLTYRATRAVNFAYGAMGGVAATVGVGLYLGRGWPWPVAVAAAVASGAAVGWACERLVIRRFNKAPRLALTVATIGLAQVLGGLELFLPGWFGSPRLVGSFQTGLNDVHVAVQPVILTGNDLVILGVVPLVLGALTWFLRRTDTGRAVRAIADNRERAFLLGLPVGRLSSRIWMLTGALAGLTVMLKAPGEGLPVDAAAGVAILLPALAAAVVADLESLPVAFVAGAGLGVVEQLVRWNVDRQATTSVVFLAVILVALVARRRRSTRVDPEASTWSSAGALRPLPAPLRALPEVRAARSMIISGVVTAAVGLPLVAAPSQLNRASVAVIYGIVAVSLVVLSGWGGVVSLGQVAVVGVGAVVSGNLVARHNTDLFVALGVAAAAGALVALLLGLPALRARGLYLAVATLGFALAMDAFVINPVNFPGLIPPGFERPVLWKRFDLGSETTFYFLCLGGLAMTVAMVSALRSSRTGRALIATRDNDRAASAAAVDVVRARLTGFVVAGALAGLAGGLHALALRGVGFHTYEPSLSLLAFSMAVIGGIGSIPGALGGVALIQGLGYAFPRLQLLLTGAALLVVLMVVPGGLAQAAQRVRDRLVTWAGRRRGLDFTPTADGSVALRSAALPSVPPAGFCGAKLSSSRMSLHRTVKAREGAALSCERVDAGYGAIQVLFGADLHVQEGEMLALLGTNGSGKSTLLRVVSGLMEPTAGRVEIHTGARPALVPGGRGIFPTLTTADNLRLACWPMRPRPRGRGRSDDAVADAARERILDLFPGLRLRLDTRAGELSGGEQQMLSLGMGLVTRPRLLLIDELSLGLAPAVVDHLVDVVRAEHATGTTVVVVEQSVTLALRLAERAVFLEKGRVRFTGPTSGLLDRPDLLRAVFLGQGDPEVPVADPSPTRDTRGTAGAGVHFREPFPEMHAAPGGMRLECRGLTRRFGGITAVDGVDLAVEPGEIVGLIGANGAGKTTCFDLIGGYLPPDGGRVTLGGLDVTHLPPHRRAVAGLGRSFQDARLYGSLTVAETVAVAIEAHFPNRDPLAAALALPASTDAEADCAARVDVILGRFGLRAYAGTLTSELSTGTRRIVELACITALDPAVVLLDEPSAGVAQREAEALVPLLRRLATEEGRAIVIIEHDMALVSGLCDRLVVLETGAVIADGDPSAVLADPVVVSSYLSSRPLASPGGVPVR